MQEPVATMRERVQVELVQSLFATTVPTVIMSLGFAAVAALICSMYPGRLIFWLSIAGVTASIVRIAIIRTSMAEAGRAGLTIERAHFLERRFAVSYIAFAAILGTFGLSVFSIPNPAVHMLCACLLVGYAAGAVAGIGLRPWIVIPSICLSTLPAAALTAVSNDPTYWGTGLLLCAFLAGGVRATLERRDAMIRELTQKITFSGLARSDVLTALPNRLALREWFDGNVLRSSRGGMIAVHCLDLDGFKPVNDEFGHPIGDELLRAVSTRLGRVLRAGDIAARLGGDEFVVIQAGLAGEHEAKLLAQRLCNSVKAPYAVGGKHIRISTSIGYVTSADRFEELDRLLGYADEALYQAKVNRGDIVCFDRKREAETVLIAA